MINGVMKPYSLIGDGYFEPLKEYVIAATGLSYYRNRNGELIDHFERHVANVGLTDCLSYLQLLQSGPAGDGELDSLIEDLTIGETFFFRHTDLFAALERTILPDAIDRNKHHRRLRIWSAGSSIGAEAYTISILLRRHFAEELRDWEISIVGTDINRSFLFRAAQAQFEEWTLRGVSEDTRRACFTQCDNVWTLRPEFKSGVSFAYHNLARHPFPSMLHNLFAFDVILFRNVMIYFGQDALTSIIANMRRCLIDGGWLLVGHSEHNQELFREFRTVNFDGAIAYQRADGDPGAVSGPSCRRPILSAFAEFPHPAVSQPSAARQHISTRRFSLKERPQQKSDGGIDLTEIRTLADRGEIEQADIQCRKIIRTQKLNPVGHLYHALILEQLGQHALSEHALRRAIYLDRRFVLAHYYLGMTLQRMGRNAEAKQSFHNTRQLLEELDSRTEIDNSDGLTVAELDELTQMQQGALK